MWIDLLSRFALFTVMDCTVYNLTHNPHSKMLAEALSQIHFGELSSWLERQREFLHSLVFSFDHLAISQLLPLLGDGKTEKCPGRSLQHLHIAIFLAKGCKPKIYFLWTFYDWSNVLDASQATLAMAGARKDGKNARTEACLACAGPCVATGLIWPLGLAWVGSLWPDVPAWVSLCGLGLRKLLYAACWSFDMPHHHSGQASQPHVCNVNWRM